MPKILMAHFDPDTLKATTVSVDAGLESLEQVDAVFGTDTLVQSGRAFRIHDAGDSRVIYSWLDFGI